MVEITIDEIILLAYALEYDCNDNIQSKINEILEKVEQNIHVDAYVGSRLAEHGRIMGWSREQ